MKICSVSILVLLALMVGDGCSPSGTRLDGSAKKEALALVERIMDESPGSDREQRLLSDLSEHASIDLLDSVINDVAPEVNNGRQFNSLMRILVILNIQNARKDGNSESYLPPGAFGKSPKDYDDPSARKEIISIWKRHVQDLKLNRPK